jgi:phosphate transport system substrate-binding protein
LKKISSNPRSAVSTIAVVAIVVVIIVVAAVGAYAAVGMNKTSTVTSVVTSGTTATVSTTAVSSVTNTVTSSVTSSVTNTVTSSITNTVTSTASSTVSISLTSTLPSETILETGSSLLYPLFNLWAPAFNAQYSTVKITPASSGSGTGQSSAETGTVQIGGSDPYLTNAIQLTYPYILNIPVAVSAQQVDYNVPGLAASIHLNFTGQVLAAIYNGSITTWNNAQIKALQSASVAASLPSTTIIPVVRSDSSGDTSLFTYFLSQTNPGWSATIGYGNTVNWPKVNGEQSGTGNGGMVTTCEQYSGCISYIGVSYLVSATTGTPALGYAYLANKAGNFVNISKVNIQSAVNAVAPSTPADERISLEYAAGATSYPIVNFEYAMVSRNQNVTGMALTLRTLLEWAISPQYGNSATYLNQVNFVPLPASVVQLDLAQINEITGP